MISLPYLAVTRPHADAADLFAAYGVDAAAQARARAEHSRRVGNHLHFCRWREVGRLIAAMTTGRDGETVH